jgi:peroxisome-assembly ATPase
LTLISISIILQALGPADYLTLASTFHTIVLTDVPALKLSQKNQARRFISLIDALYEARCALVCSASCEMEKVFFAATPTAAYNKTPRAGAAARSDDHKKREEEEEPRYYVNGHDGRGSSGIDDVMHRESIAETQDVYRPNVASYDAPRMNHEPEAPKTVLALDQLSIFSGE